MKILVTAGPTREALDPVRFISNRSTGRMGFAVACSALACGHEVCLVTGPVNIDPPAGCTMIHVETADEMLAAIRGHVEWCDVLVMAAAVADWRPSQKSNRKLKKSEMKPSIDLERTPDILDSIKNLKGDRMFIGFSADTDNVVEEAFRKLRCKQLDMIVANDISKPGSGFGTDTNEVSFICPGGAVTTLPLMAKREVGDRIVSWIEQHRTH